MSEKTSFYWENVLLEVKTVTKKNIAIALLYLTVGVTSAYEAIAVIHTAKMVPNIVTNTELM